MTKPTPFVTLIRHSCIAVLLPMADSIWSQASCSLVLSILALVVDPYVGGRSGRCGFSWKKGTIMVPRHEHHLVRSFLTSFDCPGRPVHPASAAFWYGMHCLWCVMYPGGGEQFGSRFLVSGMIRPSSCTIKHSFHGHHDFSPFHFLSYHAGSSFEACFVFTASAILLKPRRCPRSTFACDGVLPTDHFSVRAVRFVLSLFSTSCFDVIPWCHACAALWYSGGGVHQEVVLQQTNRNYLNFTYSIHCADLPVVVHAKVVYI